MVLLIRFIAIASHAEVVHSSLIFPREICLKIHNMNKISELHTEYFSEHKYEILSPNIQTQPNKALHIP